MKKAIVYVHNIEAGILEEVEQGKVYKFSYSADYAGASVSLTMPVTTKPYTYDRFPPFFDGVLPEGMQLEGLLSHAKIDRSDLFSQLTAVGADLVGAVTVRGLE